MAYDSVQMSMINYRHTHTCVMHIHTADLQVGLPFSAINPSDRQILQYDHNSERQTSRIIIKHGDKVIP